MVTVWSKASTRVPAFEDIIAGLPSTTGATVTVPGGLSVRLTDAVDPDVRVQVVVGGHLGTNSGTLGRVDSGDDRWHRPSYRDGQRRSRGHECAILQRIHAAVDPHICDCGNHRQYDPRRRSRRGHGQCGAV